MRNIILESLVYFIKLHDINALDVVLHVRFFLF